MKNIREKALKKLLETDTEVFWGEIAPTNHLLQLYSSNEVLLHTLTGFVEDGFRLDEGVIIIATEPTLANLETSLSKKYNLEDRIEKQQYLPLKAEDVLSKFIDNDWPIENKFNSTVDEIIKKAEARFPKVRAYGEMVAVLWSHGYQAATVRLEHLWHQYCKKNKLCLYCAYPRSGFTQNSKQAMKSIMDHHSLFLSGDKVSEARIYYSY